MGPEVPLRFVVFGGSLVSDWENPVATSARALLLALAELGHEVVYQEPRGNPAVLGLLRRRGSGPLRAFAERYGAIQHRTYDLPRGWERTVWFGREVATADAVLVLPGTPASFLPEIAALPKPRPVTLVDEELDGTGVYRLRRVDDVLVERKLPAGPAVLPGHAGSKRTGVLVVAYDDNASALAAVQACAELPFEHVVAGSAELPGWPFVSEVELERRYAMATAAVVAGAGGDAWAEARRLLPLAHGCRLLDPVAPEPLAAQVRDPHPVHLPARYDARLQAEGIVAAVRAALR